MAQSNVMSASTLGDSDRPGRLASAAERQAGSCCSDADRIASIVASIRGRAKLGLQVSSRLSKLIRRLNLGRGLVVVVDEIIEGEVVSVAVVVTSQMIKVKMELVEDRGDPVLKEEMI